MRSRWADLHLLYLARQQSVSAEQREARNYARDVMRRTMEAHAQFRRAVRELKVDGVPVCSAAEIDVMRRIDLASSYFQAVGRIDGDEIRCTSLGTARPIEVGRPSLINSDGGVAERFGVRVPLASSHPLTVISLDGVAALVDPYSLVNTPTEGSDISLAVYVPSMPSRGFIAAHGQTPDTATLPTLAAGEEVTTIVGDAMVSRIRSRESDVEVVVAVPMGYANRHLRRFAVIFVPLGLSCSVGLVWAVILFTRQQFSMQVLLRAGAKRGDFFVEYQPVVDLATGRWSGAEALVRWKREGRVVRPDIFIPLAEDGGVITLITECVAAAVAADLPGLMRIEPGFKIAINLSIADLHSPETVALLERTVHAAGATFRNIGVEVTERGFLQDTETVKFVDEIRNLGVSVSIDDFGTGYSSLACLQSLAVDMLKIDKAFVSTIGSDGVTSHVVHHIIDMAHSLGLEMVAEGVETEEQFHFLRSRGVQYGQGWYFAKPMSIASLREALPSQGMVRESTLSDELDRSWKG